MRLLCLANFDPARIAHGMGLVVNNTARVLFGAGLERRVQTRFALLTRPGEGGQAAPGQLRFRLPQESIAAWLERPWMGRAEFARALAGGPLAAAERRFLEAVERLSRESDAAVWFGYSWDPVTRRLPGHCRCPLVLHSNDSIALAERSRPIAPGWWAWVRRLLAEREERAVLHSGYAGAMYCSRADAETAARLAPAGMAGGIVGMANGVDTEAFRPARDQGGIVERTASSGRPPCLLFTGVMNFGPNVEAARMLIREILPRLDTPVRVRIAGKDPAAELCRLAGETPGVEIAGAVADMAEEYRAADLFVAPLERATGTKNKVLEALACGLPVLATPSVAAALEPLPGGLLEAASPAEFAARIDTLVARPGLLEELGEAGRRSVEQHYCWERRVERLVELCEQAEGGRGRLMPQAPHTRGAGRGVPAAAGGARTEAHPC